MDMALGVALNLHVLQLLFFFIGIIFRDVSAIMFTYQNSCNYTIWPGTNCYNSGHFRDTDKLGHGGFELAPGARIQLPVPMTWAGRVWARTGCNFDKAGNGHCATGDCGGKLKCNDIGTPPASFIKFDMGGGGWEDSYDIIILDGYNVGIGVRPYGGSGDCQYVSCAGDVLGNCPNELQVKDDGGQVVACKSPCLEFNTPEFCCLGDQSTSDNCRPTHYSKIFKNACPALASYPFDNIMKPDYICYDSDYIITFCPTN